MFTLLNTPEHTMSDTKKKHPSRVLAPGRPPGSKKDGSSSPAWTRRNEFGPILRELRGEAEYSLRAAAEKVGVSFSYLAKLEQGKVKRPPDLLLLTRLADIYGADPVEVMTQAGLRIDILPPLTVESGASQFARMLRVYAHDNKLSEVPDPTIFGERQRMIIWGLMEWATRRGHEWKRLVGLPGSEGNVLVPKTEGEES